ncbi:PQQ-dependent sugar dehydrogenase [Paenirhodobacter sp.]|uniref:PQQ-dependent sugar dehydrogenase n=1 Tax=Paenirhodobacter sp. TaxID=1965326 RepID=UPI003B50479C
MPPLSLSLRRMPAQAVLALALSAGAAAAQEFNDRPANARTQAPAFPGQTRAPVIQDTVALARSVVARGLVNPWGMAELPDGTWLVTERPGRMRIVSREGVLSPAVAGLPEVDARGQGGLLDVAIRADFAKDRRVWWSYAEPSGGGRNATAVATGTLSADGRRMTGVKVIFRQQPAWASTLHFGSRLVFDAEGMLFVTTGERSQSDARPQAQDPGSDLGKVLRIDPDGGPAPGNPEVAGARPGLWALGFRNVQSAAIGPDGALWTVEHGARGGDELNRVLPGRNYGWPRISYGVEYSGQPIGPGQTTRSGLEQPVYYWDPVIAPSGMAFYEGALLPEWRGSALIGGLADRSLVRLTFRDGKVTGEARYFRGEARIRDVTVARDGAVMVLTDAPNGLMIRIAPKQ